MQSEETEPTPFELIAAFQRCKNYPRDQLGVIALAQGLAKATESTGIAMSTIVNRCCELSTFCPTDADLLNVAREIRDQVQSQREANRNQHEEWEREYGSAKPFDWRQLDRRRVNAKLARDRKMNMEIRQHLGMVNGKLPNGQQPDWETMADAAEKLGYTEYAKAWRGAIGR